MGNLISQNNETLRKLRENPKPGDLIEFSRGFYKHWGLYIGDGFVVHVTLNSPSRNIPAKAVVKKEHLWDVSGSGQWKINNILDKKYYPHSAQDIGRAACQKKMSQGLKRNCEHFVTELRYGHAESQQVRKAGKGALVIGIAAAVGLGFLPPVRTRLGAFLRTLHIKGR
ncbi:phospholipase A and acyltransferase 3-like [Mugil cephalus]|uniref:phospholipase A and acyltransferase 3-like n=1 Tax=Mugil cephalus TaxID=48193 RepID=UPI001FB5C4E3|nr:phospholipase A and acyltransferase 3-like [Mugil cephalus]